MHQLTTSCVITGSQCLRSSAIVVREQDPLLLAPTQDELTTFFLPVIGNGSLILICDYDIVSLTAHCMLSLLLLVGHGPESVPADEGALPSGKILYSYSDI